MTEFLLGALIGIGVGCIIAFYLLAYGIYMTLEAVYKQYPVVIENLRDAMKQIRNDGLIGATPAKTNRK